MKRNHTICRRMFFQVLWPSLISAAALSAANMVDAVALGNRMGENGLAAIGLVTPLYMIYNVVGLAISTGGGVTHSSLTAAGKEEEALVHFRSLGILALSVGMTAASTLLAPLLTPLLVWALAGTMVDVDALGMLMSIVYVVIAPIVGGLLCQRFIPRVTRRVTPYLPAFSSVMIALLVGIIVAHNADRVLTAGLLVMVIVMIHNLLGLAIGYTVGRLLHLQKPKCVALSIEVGMQNSGLASSLAVLHYAAYPLATIPGAVFSVWHNISGALVAKLYSSNRTSEQ